MSWGKREWTCVGLGWLAAASFVAIKRYAEPIVLIDAGVALLIGFGVAFIAMRVMRPPALKPLRTIETRDGKEDIPF